MGSDRNKKDTFLFVVAHAAFQYDHSTFSHRTVYYAVLGDFNFPKSIVTIQKAVTEGFFSLSLLMLSTESGYNFGA